MRRSSTFTQMSLLLGAMLGVGMFGLPYMSVRSGFPSLVLWIVLAAALLFVVGLCYLRIIQHSVGKHRLPGYVEQHLGPHWKQAAIYSTTLSIWGAQLAYGILGSIFLSALLSPIIGGSALFYLLAFFAGGTVLLLLHTRVIARAEIVLLTLFIALVLVLFFTGTRSPSFDFLLWDFSLLILPYGVALFSLWGIDVIPDAAELGGTQARGKKKAYLASLSLAALLYIVFTFAVLSISGSETSADALDGLSGHVSEKFLRVGYLIGFIATFTSFLSLGKNLQKTFQYDYGQPKYLALFSVVAFPLVLALAGIDDYLSVISLVGSIAIGVEAIIILHMYDRFAHSRANLHPHRDWLAFLTRPLMLLLAFGVVLGILTPFFLG